MRKSVDYYFTPISPWTFLGHQRFEAIAKRAQAAINIKPVDYGRIFPASGGLPLARRAPQRQAYRLVELKRWRDFLKVPLNVEPKYFPVPADPAALLIIAASSAGQDRTMAFVFAIMRAVWIEERNIGDPETLAAIATDQGFDAEALKVMADGQEVKSRYDQYTEEAIARGVFGAPSYVYRDEVFWGQDRLDFLERALDK